MDERMKQRAVGAAVLAALAVIFVPMALDFSKEKTQETVDFSLPPPPEGEYKTVTIPMKEWADKSVADVAPARSLPEPDSTDVVLDAEPAAATAPDMGAPQMLASEAAPPAQQAATAKPTPPPSKKEIAEAKPAPKATAVASAPAQQQLKVVPKPQLAGPNTGAKAWAVQVGSFSQRKNADALRLRLRKMGYPAFVTSSETDGRTIVRVRIGPELARAEADRIKSEIERQLKLQAMVVPHR